MSQWFSKVKQDINQVVTAIDYYEDQLEQCKPEMQLRGHLEKSSRDIPAIVGYRFNQLQEIEAILEFLNIELRKLRGAKFRKYLESYNKALTSRDAEKFADADPDVISMCHLINEFALVRNKYLGVIKAIESKQFQISNIVRLRAAGLDEVTL